MYICICVYVCIPHAHVCIHMYMYIHVCMYIHIYLKGQNIWILEARCTLYSICNVIRKLRCANVMSEER